MAHGDKAGWLLVDIPDTNIHSMSRYYVRNHSKCSSMKQQLFNYAYRFWGSEIWTGHSPQPISAWWCLGPHLGRLTWLVRGWNYLETSRSYVWALGWGDLKAGLRVETYTLPLHVPWPWYSSKSILMRKLLKREYSKTASWKLHVLVEFALGVLWVSLLPCSLGWSSHSPSRFKAHESISEELNQKSLTHSWT